MIWFLQIYFTKICTTLCYAKYNNCCHYYDKSHSSRSVAIIGYYQSVLAIRLRYVPVVTQRKIECKCICNQENTSTIHISALQYFYLSDIIHSKLYVHVQTSTDIAHTIGCTCNSFVFDVQVLPVICSYIVSAYMYMYITHNCCTVYLKL